MESTTHRHAERVNVRDMVNCQPSLPTPIVLKPRLLGVAVVVCLGLLVPLATRVSCAESDLKTERFGGVQATLSKTQAGKIQVVHVEGQRIGERFWDALAAATSVRSIILHHLDSADVPASPLLFFRHVTHIELRISQLRPEHVAILQRFPNLRALSVEATTTTPQSSTLPPMPKMKVLELTGAFDQFDLTGIASWSELTSLSLIGLRVSPHVLFETVAKLRRLDSIWLEDVHLGTQPPASQAPSQVLTSVSLSNLAVESSLVSWFAKSPRLERLTLYRCKLGADGAASLSRVSTLSHLHLVHTHLHGKISELRRLTSLRSLKIPHAVEKLDDASFLVRLAALEEIDLIGVELSQRSLLVLGSLARLRALSLGGKWASVASFASLPRMVRLKELTLEAGRMQVSDPPAELALASFPALGEITVVGRGFRSHDVRPLGALKGLTLVRHARTSVPAATWEEIRAAAPELRIESIAASQN